MSEMVMKRNEQKESTVPGQEIQQMLERYCDLTWAQYQDLLDLSAGRISRIGGARRQALGELIDENLLVTWQGHQVLNRAIGLVEGTWTPLVRETEIQNPTRVSVLARNHYDGGHWIRSIHVKLMNALWRRPGQAYRSLARTYGYDVVCEILQRNWATGKPLTGSAIRPAPLGEQFVYWAFRAEKNEQGWGG